MRWARSGFHPIWGWLAGAVCVTIVVLLLLGNRPSPVRATWIWDARLIASQAEEIVSFARQNDINLIYLHIEPTRVSPQQYRSFIQAASRASVRVEALGGDPGWALAANRESIGELVAWVKAYNRTAGADERFSGIHVDIEPYLLQEWKENQENVASEWMRNIVYLVAETKKDSTLSVSADLPFWIDSVTVPDGSEKLSSWMLERLDSITLMAYRNHAQGPNGIVDIVQKIVADADTLGKGSVVVGVNILESQEGENVSFHQMGTQEMESELAILQEELGDRPSFAGSAVHDYESWLHASRREEQRR